MRYLQCMLYNNNCYKAGRYIKPTRIVVHSTGANNPNLRRYVQPHSTQTTGMAECGQTQRNYNRSQMLEILGKNNNGNDWNRSGLSVCVNAFIGKLADGTIATVQTLPWNMRPWGVGSGRKGSFNDCAIQFEICEDNLSSASYCKETYKEAVELCAMLCRAYDISPDNIVGHYEAYEMGYGSNHGDPKNWWPKHGLSMSSFRRDVKSALNGNSTSAPDSAVDILAKKGIINSPDYWEDKQDDLKYLDNLLENIAKIAGSKVVADVKTVSKAISRLVEYKVISSPDYWTKNYSKIKYLDVLLISAANHIGEAEFESYKVKVTTDALNIRKGAGTNYAIVGCIRDEGVYTIVDENNGWGLLKSYAKDRNGWISLAYTKKV